MASPSIPGNLDIGAGRRPRRHARMPWLAPLLLGLALPAAAGVLPEDRADALYHLYDGGGATIDGPSVLVRKSLGEKISLSGRYYVDSISSASIDVVTTASEYREERTETGVGLDFLRGGTTLSLAFTESDETDFAAQSAFFNVSQDLFGDLTTISLGYGIGKDEVSRRNDLNFADEADRQHYRLGVSQILTKNLLLGLTFETITDEGFLNNPYRQVRYLDPNDARGYNYEAEVYPRTRTSNAFAIRSRYYLDYRAALHAEYRFSTDTWDIDAHTAAIGYTHPTDGGWTFELQYRYYTQTAAEFYSDLFPRVQAQNFLARDKELSSFRDHSIRVGTSYEFLRKGWNFIDKATINFYYDFIQFDYDNFRDLRVTGVTPGEEPAYNFDAHVVQLYLSFWY